MKNKIIRFIVNSLLLMSCAQLSGCIAVNKIPYRYTKDIHTIAINKSVSFPNDIDYECKVPSKGAGALNCLLGDVGSNMTQQVTIKKLIDDNKIRINQMVLNEFVVQMSQKTRFKIIENDPSDAVLKIKVFNYGFLPPPQLNYEKLKPMLQVSVSLQKDGTTIWEDGNFCTPFSVDTPMCTYEGLVKNPKMIEVAFKAAAKSVVSKIVKEMS